MSPRNTRKSYAAGARRNAECQEQIRDYERKLAERQAEVHSLQATMRMWDVHPPSTVSPDIVRAFLRRKQEVAAVVHESFQQMDDDLARAAGRYKRAVEYTSRWQHRAAPDDAYLAVPARTTPSRESVATQSQSPSQGRSKDSDAQSSEPPSRLRSPLTPGTHRSWLSAHDVLWDRDTDSDATDAASWRGGGRSSRKRARRPSRGAARHGSRSPTNETFPLCWFHQGPGEAPHLDVEAGLLNSASGQAEACVRRVREAHRLGVEREEKILSAQVRGAVLKGRKAHAAHVASLRNAGGAPGGAASPYSPASPAAAMPSACGDGGCGASPSGAWPKTPSRARAHALADEDLVITTPTSLAPAGVGGGTPQRSGSARAMVSPRGRASDGMANAPIARGLDVAGGPESIVRDTPEGGPSLTPPARPASAHSPLGERASVPVQTSHGRSRAAMSTRLPPHPLAGASQRLQTAQKEFLDRLDASLAVPSLHMPSGSAAGSVSDRTDPRSAGDLRRVSSIGSSRAGYQAAASAASTASG